MRSFYGNFLYMPGLMPISRPMAHGLREVSETAVLHANYMMNKLKDVYKLPYDRTCIRVQLSGEWQKTSMECVRLTLPNVS